MDDLISRAAAIDALIEWYGCEPSDIGAFENIIEKLPSAQAQQTCEYWDSESKFCALCRPYAQPERKTGRWIDNETSYVDDARQTCTCSVCGRRSHRPLGRFCRWCGARMEADT